MFSMVFAAVLWAVGAQRFWRLSTGRYSPVVLGQAILYWGFAAHVTLNIAAVESALHGVIGNGTVPMKFASDAAAAMGAAIVASAAIPAFVGQARRWIAIHVGLATTGFLAAAALFFSARPRLPVMDDADLERVAVRQGGGYGLSYVVSEIYPLIAAFAIFLVFVPLLKMVRSPRDYGVILICIGAAVSTVYAAIRGTYALAAPYVHGDAQIVFDITPILAYTGALGLLSGVIYSTVYDWIRATRGLRRITGLHDYLVTLWPGVKRESWSRATRIERAEDRSVEVLDALYMEGRSRSIDAAGARRTPDEVATWLVTLGSEAMSIDALAAPEGTDALDWVQSIADEWRTK
ncbi:Integral membrane protein OS=Tsukamurella paurometabola (strain ATCC 8368 / DSM / CCUG 35730/ CIP 100753 / JCM 10117 / KCTC 9821 / NBRC 16120 / NCIMB 702349/ NCTC 13040) OX=521096 GN=Tpau_1056 PE=4 SV=1 [Tsukamurella paurometabola]|uniref:Integral membrane protein n=1 Tax=Tsukamurella paurometabola (strain ATCC 8368 / DSM 20162 / CCUG 35730 / CIP 100753 / JCM 10117 / KCTC 9821 / NBRC 16120 / NCIMB 702349 / NCTC 13040) TaxID=521096 RepID=D5UV98_TSUPD|nr:hypothetical protein [Tsukamurella paurometabola]ADG77688.1 conserved hypothetical protein [Tsukamurella paurometabola DSM 20162]SUP28312.1 Uncharacterised protein [Tsukamurella paurometabola]